MCQLINDKLPTLFDILGNETSIKSRVEAGNPEMTVNDWKFYNSMKSGDRRWGCSGVDKEHEKQVKAEEVVRKESNRKAAKKLRLQSSSTESIVSEPLVGDNDSSNSDDEWKPATASKPEFLSPARKQTVASSSFTSPPSLTRSNTNAELSSPPSLNKLQLRSPQTTPRKPMRCRVNERNFDNQVMQTYATLIGAGLSYHQASLAVATVANKIFGTNWAVPNEEGSSTTNENVDILDLLPTHKSIREHLSLLAAHTMKLQTDMLMSLPPDAAVGYGCDSTTRRVGKFTAGMMTINKDISIPMPILPTASETTEDIADGVRIHFDMLAAVSDYTAEEIYDRVDVHITDSTAHNKGLAAAVAEKFGRESPAGQIYCTTHTALGFDRAMEKVANAVETEIGMENLFQAFLIDVEIDSNHQSVSIGTLKWISSLFGPDLSSKPWNQSNAFKTYLKSKGKPMQMFYMKDSRFGYLSKASAVTLYHWDDFSDYLATYQLIDNKLACLVRDAMKLDFIKIVLAVIAVFGVQLVEPYYQKTTSTKVNHSELCSFFTEIHAGLKFDDTNDDFMEMTQPLRGVSPEPMKAVKTTNYKPDVIAAVLNIVHQYPTEAKLLAEKIRPKLHETLVNQRGKQYGFGTDERSEHVFDQTPKIDQTPINNMGCERACGTISYKLGTKPYLDTVSRDIILHQSEFLRDIPNSEFYRKMRPAVAALKAITDSMKAHQENLKAQGLAKKEIKRYN